MTLLSIAGFVTDHGAEAEARCRTALVALDLFGSSPVISSADLAAFGAVRPSVHRQIDHKPRQNGRYLCVSDARLDNARELRRHLGLCDSASSSAIILEAFSLWQRDCVHHLLGDYAFAIFDRQTRYLHLARDPAGYRSLFYFREAGIRGFASAPSALLAVRPGRANLRNLALYLEQVARPIDESCWEGVANVPPGSIVELSAERTCARPFFSSPAMDQSPDWKTLVEEMRHRLDRAVARNLADAGRRVASQLSSGLDSSAVTATAARTLGHDGHLLALTSAPAGGARLLVPRGRFADEAELAGQTAGSLGIEHIVVRERHRYLPSLRGLAPYFQQPAPAQYSFPWWRRMIEIARERGSSVLLVGGQGNAGLSYGGLHALPRYLRAGRIGRWAHEFYAVKREEDVRWRGLLFNSVAPLLSPKIAGLALRASAGNFAPRPHFLREEWRSIGSNPTPNVDYMQTRLAMIRGCDAAMRTRGFFGLSGVEERDPTGDRELLEFTLSLPPEAHLAHGRIKPLIRDALADRIPQVVLGNRARGLCGADWYDQIDEADSRDALDEIRCSPTASELLDVEKLAAAIANWPAFDSRRAGALGDFGQSIGRALSTGLFLAETDRYPLGSSDRQ